MDWKNEICSISQSPEAETLRGQKIERRDRESDEQGRSVELRYRRTLRKTNLIA